MSFIRKSVVKGHTYYQRCESYREGGKVKTRVLEHLGKNPNGKTPTPTPTYAPPSVDIGKLREREEMLEAEIARLKAENHYLNASKDRLLRELKEFGLDDIPRTYQGALEYIELCCDRRVHPDPAKIAAELNSHNFPAFKGEKWDKSKVKRQFDKFTKPKPQTGKTIDVKATPIAV